MLRKFFIAVLLIMSIQISAAGTTGGTTGEGGTETGRVNCHADVVEFSRC